MIDPNVRLAIWPGTWSDHTLNQVPARMGCCNGPYYRLKGVGEAFCPQKKNVVFLV
jgi:hypothetical protein